MHPEGAMKVKSEIEDSIKKKEIRNILCGYSGYAHISVILCGYKKSQGSGVQDEKSYRNVDK